MRIYVTSRQQSTLDLWTRMLPASTVIEFVNEGDRRIQADAYSWWNLVVPRYGGDEFVSDLRQECGIVIPVKR